MEEQPFSLDRDPRLGDALRALLEGDDPAGFAARLTGRLPRRPSAWRVLAGWARPGIAAALVLATALGFWLVRGGAESGSGDAPAELSATDRPLDQEALMGFALGEDR